MLSTMTYEVTPLQSKNEEVSTTLAKKTKKKLAPGIYGNPIEISVIRNNQLPTLRSLKSGKSGFNSFGKFAMTASLYVGFHLGTSSCNFFH